MPAQTGQNIQVNYEVEATFNTDPAGTGERLRLNPSPGLSMTRPTILPGEIRADLLSSMGRLGSRTVTGSYSGDISVRSFDTIWEAVLRGTFVAAVAITDSEMTSITTTTNTIVAAAGSWLTEGVRVGDLVRLTGHATAANNDLNLLVSAVVAATITVQGTPLTADAVADTSFTLTILKKVVDGGTVIRRTFFIDEYNVDIDLSEVFGGCKFDGFTINGTPDGMATVEFPVVGASVTARLTGTSPSFASPTIFTTDGLVFVDAQIRLAGVSIVDATAFNLTRGLGSATLPVIGSTVTPDIFDGTAVMSGSLSLLRTDLQRIIDFEAETEYELHILLEEPSGTPLSAISIFLPRIKLVGVEAALGEDGGMIETLPFIVGAKPTTTGYDTSMMTLCTET